MALPPAADADGRKRLGQPAGSPSQVSAAGRPAPLSAAGAGRIFARKPAA